MLFAASPDVYRITGFVEPSHQVAKEVERKAGIAGIFPNTRKSFEVGRVFLQNSKYIFPVL